MQITNTGEIAGDEIVQLYIRDLVGEDTRPVKEQKASRKSPFSQAKAETSNSKYRFSDSDSMGWICNIKSNPVISKSGLDQIQQKGCKGILKDGKDRYDLK